MYYCATVLNIKIRIFGLESPAILDLLGLLISCWPVQLCRDRLQHWAAGLWPIHVQLYILSGWRDQQHIDTVLISFPREGFPRHQGQRDRLTTSQLQLLSLIWLIWFVFFNFIPFVNHCGQICIQWCPDATWFRNTNLLPVGFGKVSSVPPQL